MAQGHIQITPADEGFVWKYENGDTVVDSPQSYPTSSDAVLVAGKHYPNVPFDVEE